MTALTGAPFIAAVVTAAFVVYITYAYWLLVRSRGRRGPSLVERGGLARWLPLFVWVPYVVVWTRPGPEIPVAAPLVLLGLALAVAGPAFAIWAAATLGRHFHVEVQVHRGHEVVRAGPYGLVRHPIYSGLALHFIGACLATGNLVLLAGTLFAALPGLYLRARAEEELLRAELGEPYERYMREVPMLVPAIGP